MVVRALVPRSCRGRGGVAGRRPARDPFYGFHRDVDRLFGGLLTDLPLVSLWGESEPAAFSPRIDLSETDKEVRVSAELPGMDEKDVTVEMVEEAIVISGERKAEQEDQDKNWYRKEQSYGSFHRTIPLPADVDGSKAKATFKKGLLTVTVPKREDAEPKRRTIAIESD